MCLKIILAAAFGLLFVSSNFAQKQEVNYSAIFANDYQRAIQFLKSEKRIDSIIRSHGLNEKEVIAIIFPELIRYNSIQDKIETFALETLYIQYGKNYADFSVGEFQIKPSFAENIEIDFIKLFGGMELSIGFKIKASDTVQNQENRLNRLKRIKDKIGMANYLCLFSKIMNAKYPVWKSEEEKVKFFACAYNCGYWKPEKIIREFLSKKYFHTGLSITTKKYCYADIAWYYFKQPEK